MCQGQAARFQGIATEQGRINGRNYPTRKDIELKF